MAFSGELSPCFLLKETYFKPPMWVLCSEHPMLPLRLMDLRWARPTACLCFSDG